MSSDDPPPAARKGIVRGVALAGVYLLGLLSWAVWVGAIVYLVVRFFAPD